MKLNPHRAGLSLGLFFALFHLVWSIFLASGLAKTWIDIKMSMHGISMPYTLTTMSVGNSILLIISALVVGYVWGLVFAAIWNNIHK